MAIQFRTLDDGEGHVFLTALIGGEIYTASNQHPAWDAIKAGVQAGDENVAALFDVSKAVAEKFSRLTERTTLRGGTVYHDGDPVDDELSNEIVRFIEAGEDDWKPLVAFIDNVMANPNEHSRQQAYRWLAHRFPFNEDGTLLGYKSVTKQDDGTYLSHSSGKATVNGEVKEGQIPQALGDIVEMPRSEVQHDPSVGCHTGLHVGTWDYARSFGGSSSTVLLVEVNPRDIVSVPTDAYDAKVRVNRYKVIREVTAPVGELVVRREQDTPVQDALPVQDVTKAQRVYGRPTDTNYTRQKRDANGRFIPKA